MSIIHTDSDMLDTVEAVIILLIGALVISYFGVDSVIDGLSVLWHGMVQIISAVLFHNVVPGPIAEDDPIHVIIFTVRDWLGLGRGEWFPLAY